MIVNNFSQYKNKKVSKKNIFYCVKQKILLCQHIFALDFVDNFL